MAYFILQNGYRKLEQEYQFDIQQDMNYSGRDKRVFFKKNKLPRWEKGTYLERKYILYDETGKILDFRDYRTDIVRYIKPFELEKETNELILKKYRYNPTTFRNAPVPGTGKHVGWKIFRQPKVARLKRYSADMEHQPFTRAKDRFKNLPVWDDYTRQRSRSWKSSYRCKYQWEKFEGKRKKNIILSWINDKVNRK